MNAADNRGNILTPGKSFEQTNVHAQHLASGKIEERVVSNHGVLL